MDRPDLIPVTQQQQLHFQAMRHKYGMPQHGARVETPAMTPVHLIVRRICIHLANGGAW
jgi:hypothetical protein